MNLWLDDYRSPPSDGQFWIWLKTSEEAIECISFGNISYISFDHDLGVKPDGSLDEAIDVAKYIEDLAHEGKISRIEWDVHSQNPVGKGNIIAAMKSADRYWTQQEAKEDIFE